MAYCIFMSPRARVRSSNFCCNNCRSDLLLSLGLWNTLKLTMTMKILDRGTTCLRWLKLIKFPLTSQENIVFKQEKLKSLLTCWLVNVLSECNNLNLKLLEFIMWSFITDSDTLFWGRSNLKTTLHFWCVDSGQLCPISPFIFFKKLFQFRYLIKHMHPIHIVHNI